MKGEPMSIADIKNGVSRLSAKEQAALAYWIISNLDEVADEDDSADAAWRQEVRSRVKAIKTGKVEMIPAAEMWKDILDSYAKTG
jgi:putative addiction module component (TIGR02574 family)